MSPPRVRICLATQVFSACGAVCTQRQCTMQACSPMQSISSMCVHNLMQKRQQEQAAQHCNLSPTCKLRSLIIICLSAVCSDRRWTLCNSVAALVILLYPRLWDLELTTELFLVNREVYWNKLFKMWQLRSMSGLKYRIFPNTLFITLVVIGEQCVISSVQNCHRVTYVCVQCVSTVETFYSLACRVPQCVAHLRSLHIIFTFWYRVLDLSYLH